jgi:hypothetical protein
MERGHVLRLGFWAAACVVTGGALLSYLWWRKMSAPLVKHFAIQTLGWGLVNATIAHFAWRDIALRDFTSAQSLVNLLWLNIGLAVGYALVGITLALAAWRMGPRLAGIGAGLGILVQGVVLCVLDTRLVLLIGPLG